MTRSVAPPRATSVAYSRRVSEADHPIIARLPPEARATFGRLLQSAVRSPDELRAQLPHYVRAIEQAADSGGPPAALGHAIARDCERLLNAWPRLDDEGQALARAAVQYFLLARDGDDDLATPEGLDDDAAVVAVVRAHLGC